jgi:uncharacterized protein (TIGR02391 family)
MVKRTPAAQPIEERVFQSHEEIDLAIKKLERRITELQGLGVAEAVATDNGAEDVARSNVRAAIREVFGLNSPEFKEHQYLRLWVGPEFMGMSRSEIIAGTQRGVTQTVGILNGLIKRLREKQEDMSAGIAPAPSSYFDHLRLHPRILDVSRDLFLDNHHWEAVFAGAKALVNYVKERSGRHDLDGAPLMRMVFSKNSPLLAFNALKDQTDLDEQEGTMHLFEGATLAIRNPGGHSFPEGTEQRALEYISLLSLLAYRVQEAKKPKGN